MPLSPNISIQIGDLLEYPNDGYVIVHQCNCTSTTVLGLAKKIFDKWPDSDVRNMKNRLDLFGTHSYTHPVVNLFSQKHKGAVGPGESSDQRLDAFYESFVTFLSRFGNQPIKVAVPYLIGCGMARGNWEQDYFPLIQKIAEEYPQHQFVIVQFNQ